MNARLQGIVAFGTPSPGPVRILGLGAGDAVLAEAMADRDGRWELSSPAPVEWVVAHLSGTGIAAVAGPAAEAPSLRLPELLATRIAFEAAPPGARLWLDPMALSGLSGRFLPALRRHPEGTIDLHLLDRDAAGEGLTVLLQPGRYRLGGGVLAIRPWEVRSGIAEIVGLGADRPLPRDGDAFLLDADGSPLRVAFEPQGPAP